MVNTAFTTLAALSGEDRATWRELLPQSSASAPFVDEAWLSSFTEAFAPPAPMLLCAWEARTLVGLAALQRLTEPWAGRRVAVLQSLTNLESFRFDFLAAQDRPYVLEALWHSLCKHARCDVIRLDHLPQDSLTIAVGLNVARASGWTHHVEVTFPSPWRRLVQPPAPWDLGLRRKFKANLRNRERRIQALGEVTFEVANGTDGQARALEAFYGLEASSWKGTRGTAIGLRPDERAFYDRLVARTSAQMWIPVLSVAGRPAAAQLIRIQGRQMMMLKTAYHPQFAPFTPGQLLTARLIRYGIEQGMDSLDFLADDMTWKADWAPQYRPHYRLLLFSPSANGRYAYWMRYGVRERLKMVPGARRLVRWLRAGFQTRRARDRAPFLSAITGTHSSMILKSSRPERVTSSLDASQR